MLDIHAVLFVLGLLVFMLFTGHATPKRKDNDE
jgi:hypothetical protein